MDQDKLRDIVYRRAVAARNIGMGLAGEFVSHYDAVIDDLTKEIAGRYAKIEANGFDKGPKTTAEMEAMLKAYRAIRDEVYKPASKGLLANLEKIAQAEHKFAANAVKTAGGLVDMRAVIPSHDFDRNLILTTPLPYSDKGQTLLMPWLEHWDRGTIRAVEGALRMGANEGLGTAQMVARLIGTKERDGILQTSRRDATTIALTANSGIQNSARLETFKRMKSIKFLEWSSILDDRVSAICAQRSGTIYPIDGPHPSPPAHPRCRSILLPRRDDEGTKHKPVGEWLRDQPAHVQDEVLDGKARGDVFRANPKFDFQGYFREGGGFKTLGELRKYDERLFTQGGVKSPARRTPAPAPQPEPAPEPKRFVSPYATAPKEADFTVTPKAKVKKALTERMVSAAQDARHDPQPEFRGIKATDFGKVTFSADLTDEAASMIATMMGEVDAITDGFNVPRIRGIRTAKGRAVADMGDSTLGIAPAMFNHWARKLAPAVAGDEAEAIREQMLAIRARMAETRDRAEWRKLAKQFDTLYRKVNTREDASVSTWKIGDDVKQRKFNAFEYFPDGVDRARQTIYHEVAHTVHQMWNKTERRSRATPPLELRLKALYSRVRGRFAEFPSNYATTNEKEWFAESFSLYMMDRKDLVMEEMIELIEEVLNEQTK